MTQRNLTLVGLTEDKQRLVLVSDSGEEFLLAADARLRAALRGEHARLGQLEITMESALRPRDIQARIRAGESPEMVASAAQTTVDKIMGFATPVLAERAHIAQRAQQASVRRTASQGASRILADAVAERLHSRNVEATSVEWDAWRRDDGRWTVVVDYRSGERPRHAEFVFDAPGRYVVAEDEEARWLVGEQSASHGPQPRAASGPRRLSAVGDAGPDDGGAEDQLPLGADAIDLVREDPSDAGDVPVGATGEADWIATQATARPERAEQPVEPVHTVELGSEADEPDLDEALESMDDPAAEGSSEDDPASAPRRTSRKGRRASVPSWDEIMFGGGKSE
jgi:Protein of unknown function (DUF3071)